MLSSRLFATFSIWWQPDGKSPHPAHTRNGLGSKGSNHPGDNTSSREASGCVRVARACGLVGMDEAEVWFRLPSGNPKAPDSSVLHGFTGAWTWGNVLYYGELVWYAKGRSDTAHGIAADYVRSTGEMMTRVPPHLQSQRKKTTRFITTMLFPAGNYGFMIPKSSKR